MRKHWPLTRKQCCGQSEKRRREEENLKQTILSAHGVNLNVVLHLLMNRLTEFCNWASSERWWGASVWMKKRSFNPKFWLFICDLWVLTALQALSYYSIPLKTPCKLVFSSYTRNQLCSPKILVISKGDISCVFLCTFFTGLKWVELSCNKGDDMSFQEQKIKHQYLMTIVGVWCCYATVRTKPHLQSWWSRLEFLTVKMLMSMTNLKFKKKFKTVFGHTVYVANHGVFEWTFQWRIDW